jgi:hypothetical protein
MNYWKWIQSPLAFRQLQLAFLDRERAFRLRRRDLLPPFR